MFISMASNEGIINLLKRYGNSVNEINNQLKTVIKLAYEHDELAELIDLPKKFLNKLSN